VVTIDGIENLHYKTPKSISVSTGGNGGSTWKQYARKVPFLTICTETNPHTLAYKDRKCNNNQRGQNQKIHPPDRSDFLSVKIATKEQIELY
jgi:hypothetical protein